MVHQEVRGSRWWWRRQVNAVGGAEDGPCQKCWPTAAMVEVVFGVVALHVEQTLLEKILAFI